MFHEELDAYLGNNRRDRLYGKSLVKDLMLNEYCPELGRIMEELVSGGLAERLLVMSPVRDSEREIAEFLVFAEEAKEELGKKGNFRQDLVDYAIDSVSYALGFLNKVRVPPEAEDDPFDDLEKDYVPYEEQDKYYSVGSMLDIIYEFDDFLDELMLGRAYEYGDGIRQSYPRAMKWFRRSADYGIAEAMVEIGNMYCCGTGVREDPAGAESWYRKAAESPFELAARYHLGTMYREGKGVPRDPGEAVRLFLSAVAFGCPEADSRSGRCMRRARASPPDPGEAVQYYRDASWWGSAEAMFRLGTMYRDGRGAEQDLRRAGKLFDDAAKLGHKGAAEALSRMPGEDGGARTAQ